MYKKKEETTEMSLQELQEAVKKTEDRFNIIGKEVEKKKEEVFEVYACVRRTDVRFFSRDGGGGSLAPSNPELAREAYMEEAATLPRRKLHELSRELEFARIDFEIAKDRLRRSQHGERVPSVSLGCG